jgi:hypothetical protein
MAMPQFRPSLSFSRGSSLIEIIRKHAGNFHPTPDFLMAKGEDQFVARVFQRSG